MSEYTSGPWRYQEEESYYPGLGPNIEYQIYTESGLYANPATCRNEANARLVAASPELYEALRGIMDHFAHGGTMQMAPWLIARSALNKVEGVK